MNDDTENNRHERRRHPRFKIKPNVVAMLIPGHEKLGPVFDISVSGLSFLHMNADIITEECFSVCLSAAGTDILLNSVPVRAVFDTAISDDKDAGEKIVRRCGVQFEILTDEHAAQIDRLIKNYTNML